MADSVFLKNTNIYYDKETGAEYRTIMRRDIIICKDNGHTQEDYSYIDTPQPHVGLVNEPAKSVCLFDDLGRLTEMSNYFTGGTPRTKDVYTYDSSGTSGKIDSYDFTRHPSIISIKSELTLDDRNRITRSEQRSVVYVDSPLVITHVYDKESRPVKEEWHNTGSPATTLYQYKYDKNGDMIERRIDHLRDLVITNSHVITFSYSAYDNKHNWTVQNSYEKDRLIGILERHIVYHK